MKHFKLLCFALFAMVITSCGEESPRPSKIVASSRSSAVIGEIINNVPFITCNTDEVLRKWNNDLVEMKPNLTALLIRKNGEGQYLLVASGTEYRSTRLLTLDPSNNVLFFNGIITTCTTSSRSSGCEVTVDGRCSTCKGECTKTTTKATN